MADQNRPGENPLAYGDDYNQSRGSGNQRPGKSSLFGDAFKMAKTKYDQYSQKPQQDYGYGAPSQQQQQQPQQQIYSQGPGQQQSYQQSQQHQPWGQPPQQPGYQVPGQNPYGGAGQPASSPQPSYPGGPSAPQGGQPKPDLASKLLGGLHSTIHSIGTDLSGMLGASYQGQPHGAQTQQSLGGKNRFDSFAAPREGNQVKWYVDGCNYMWAVSQALESARQSIWILDWWLSPELYLRRPPAANEEWRLDRILQRAAQRGVKINIIVYKEVTQALTLSSHHTKEALEKLSPNIAVFRHPDHLPDAQTAHSSIISSLQGLKLDAAGASKLGADALKGIYGLSDGVILYWAHHEKLCLIDGQVAFMGGLDLCYGRWDTHQHSIADAHPSDLNKIVFPGQDFNNARVMDFNDVPNPYQNKLDRTKSSRMGWSDISICLQGPCTDDLRHHFTDRWNFIYDEKYNVRKDVRYTRLPPVAGHHAGEGPQLPPGTATQQGASGNQFPPPPGSQSYQAPPWQATSSTANTLAVGTPDLRPHSPQSGSFPPPPPGPPPQGNVGAQPNYGAYQQQPAATQPLQPTYQAQSSPYLQPQSQPSYERPPSPYTQGPPPHASPSPALQTSYAGYEQHQTMGTSQASHGVASQDSFSQPYPPSQPPQSYAGQPFQTGQQTFAPPPQSQSPMSQQQYQAYHASDQQQQQPQQSPYQQAQGVTIEPPSNLSQQQSYAAYHPTETTRGFGDFIPQHGSGQQGSTGTQGGDGRGGRFDQYKHEGRMLGNELGAIGSMIQGKVEQKIGRPSSRAGGAMRCQMLRSTCRWSNGTLTEHSIQTAYIDVIEKSQHFVYIENQFFITATGEHQKPVKNQIGKALVERIIRAARERTPYKVIVIMPAIPAFAGDFMDEGSLGTRAICEFQYFSICRGGHSIMEEIAKAGINPMDYIRFYNLRNYDRINYTSSQAQAQQQSGVSYEDARKQQENALGAGYAGQGYSSVPSFHGNPAQQYQGAVQHAPNVAADRWDSVASCYMLHGEDIRKVPWSGPPEAEIDAFVSEELYVHSKVIIADDQVVICGSANINDRSMLGNHDSEIALLIYDTTPQQSMMAGRPWQASRFAASLRRQLFRKHLGLLPAEDPAWPNANFEPVHAPNAYDWGSPEDNLVADPLADTFQSFWNTRARTNTEVFRKAFRAVPDDYVRSWTEYKEFYEYYFAKAGAESVGQDKGQTPSRVEYGHVVRSDFPGGVQELKDHLSRVKGTLVEMPLCFLQNEDIAKEGLSLNALTEEVYT